MNEKYYPRVLIISNEGISQTSSNGRTLRNFMIGWPEDRLAQFYIKDSNLDFSICKKFYRVTDKDALIAFLKGIPVCGEITEYNSAKITTKASAKETNEGEIKRTPLTMICRDIVWNSRRWMGTDFWTWVDSLAPEVVLIQSGDCAFMLRLARKIAKKYNASLVMYNSESYYFKDYEYMQTKGISKYFYPIFHWYYCKEFERAISAAQQSIYCCEMLRQEYYNKFHMSSNVVYTASEIEPLSLKKSHNGLRISYLGNLGIDRHIGLIEIADELQLISPEYKLEVYGNIPNQIVKDAFEKNAGIEYKGFVSYDDVIQIMRNSDILVHTENFSDYWIQDLKYAFSTKIADSLASGTCFLLYADETLACSKYLKENDAAYVISDKRTLSLELRNICKNIEARNKYIENAISLAKKNHTVTLNAEKFQEILRNSTKGACNNV